MKSYGNRHGGVVTSQSVFGAPCWVSLTTRDLRAAEDFYHAVLGWEWDSDSKMGEQYRIARVDKVPVAGLSEVDFVARTAVAWTAYFAVSSANETVARSQERGGTTAVGPISLPPGRAALLADRDGAVFGIWEGELVSGWETWRRAAPVFIRLHTRDAFDAALFYGEVLDWASSTPGCCEVRYEENEVVLRSQEQVVARIHSGAVGAAPDPTIRPHWQIHFAVSDVEACARAARAHGGTAHQQGVGSTEAVLSDPDGAHFTVTSKAAV
ncbi:MULTISPECIES: VOC family protein [Streptomyces]|uniref:VOC family protein n=1 Tax=Streptomyces dengpaensis TaxID=2049881 RepID=A0ABM6SJR9_9ACTN|nr:MULTISPECIES: VOC family protein [Streptomyces]AVH54902.1 VOC family protein [Streptomyces dengpaensis]PIB08204.1 bleomycin resistance protein [Streptomyces sp. HG99]